MTTPHAADRSLPAGPVASTERVAVLDVLRGIALLGMLLVHFHDHAGEGPGWTEGLMWGIDVFAAEKFFALFALLFGAGFAIQLRRAEGRGTRFVPVYLRRLAGLFVFGFAAHALLGFNVLLGYSLVAVPLLLVRRWSTRSLVLLALTFTLGWAVLNAAVGVYEWATLGLDGANRAHDARVQAIGAQWAAVSDARAQPSYAALVAARLRHMAWFYRQRWMLVPNELPLFVFGLLAVRCGLLEEPRRHTRLIAGIMATGLCAWAVATWALPRVPELGPWGVTESIRYSSRLGQWLTFTYAGGVTLLIAHRARWAHLLAPFGWAGRMALSNYFLQILALDVLLSGYGLGLRAFSPVLVVPATLCFFGAQAALSRAWLSRYAFGPLEWLWRSATYGRFQPLRKRRGPVGIALAGEGLIPRTPASVPPRRSG